MEGALLAPVVGLLVNRLTPRRMIFVGSIIICLSLILLGRMTSLIMFYGAAVLLSLGSSVCAETVLLSTIARWFHRKVGMAAGIMLSGYGVGGLLIPIIVKLIDRYDWRIAMTALGFSAIAIIMPLSLVFRHKPEQYGYLPDGGVPEAVAVKKAEIPGVGTLTIKKSLRSRVFWFIAFALTCQRMAQSVVTTHVMPYLDSVGITRATAAWVAGATLLTGIGGRLSFGWLADKFEKRYVAAVSIVLMGLGLIMFESISASRLWMLIPFFVFFPTGFGGSTALVAPLVREHFGVEKFPAITGLMNGMMALGGIVGAPLAALAFDRRGSYQGVWLVLAGILLVALLSMLTSGRAKQLRPTFTVN